MRIWRARHKFNLLENIRKVFIINRKSKKKKRKGYQRRIRDSTTIHVTYEGK